MIGNVKQTENELIQHQIIYPVCESHWYTNIFYVVLFIYKLGQLMYAIDNEVGKIIGVVILFMFIVCVGLINAIWYVLNQLLYDEIITPNVQYGVINSVNIFVFIMDNLNHYYFCRKSKRKKMRDLSQKTNNQETTTRSAR